jgi:hypothetical protein
MILQDEVNELTAEETGSALLQGTDHTTYIELYMHESVFGEIQNDPNRGLMWGH